MSFEPQTETSFWIQYSTLLANIWSNPGTAARLKTRTAEELAYFNLRTQDGATFTINSNITLSSPDFKMQYDLWKRGEATGHYLLFIPEHRPEATFTVAGEISAVAADSVACCCSCCPCCSCF
ncbi:hypothetical protein WME94_01155 [Sorangium sp. So ce429]